MITINIMMKMNLKMQKKNYNMKKIPNMIKACQKTMKMIITIKRKRKKKKREKEKKEKKIMMKTMIKEIKINEILVKTNK